MEDNNSSLNQNNPGPNSNQSFYQPDQQYPAPDQSYSEQNFNYNPANSGSYPLNNSSQDTAYGPRRLSLFILFSKTFLGFVGGVVGSLVLLLIFLASASILQPVLGTSTTTSDQISPVFIVILMAMIFVTSLISSILSPLLLSYTERQRYPRIMTALYQIFIINLTIFVITAPIYLTTSTTSIEFTAYAAGLQIILVATASSLIMEILNDDRYPLMAVYSTIIGILISTTINLFLYQLLKSTTVLLFAALPITWASIGFFQATLAMMYYWYYLNYGNDFLATSTSYGTEYAGVAEEEEASEEVLPEDKNGNDFFKS